MNDITAGFLFCTRHFTSYQGCRFLLHSARLLIQTGLYKGVIAGKKVTSISWSLLDSCFWCDLYDAVCLLELCLNWLHWIPCLFISSISYRISSTDLFVSNQLFTEIHLKMYRMYLWAVSDLYFRSGLVELKVRPVTSARLHRNRES